MGVGRYSKNFRDAGAPTPWDGAWITPINTLLPTCYHTKLGRSGSYSMGVGRNSRNFRDAGAPTPWNGGVADPNTLLCACVIVPNFVALGQILWA